MTCEDGHLLLPQAELIHPGSMSLLHVAYHQKSFFSLQFYHSHNLFQSKIQDAFPIDLSLSILLSVTLGWAWAGALSLLLASSFGFCHFQFPQL